MNKTHKQRKNFVYKLKALLLAFIFSCSSLSPVGLGISYAQVPAILNLPTPGTMVSPSPAHIPVLLTGMTLHPDNPLRFDFIVDSGHTGYTPENVKQEAQKLVKYFLAAMTVPKNDLWVNLSPYEEDRIIPEELGKTELGRDLLAQDYLLKQLTASLLYPEEDLGEEFWSRVYDRAQKEFGTTEIPVNTFNKVWVLPDTASVYESGDTVYVVESRLKVLLDSDYTALNSEKVSTEQTSQQKDQAQELGEQIIREIILPEIEREVNEGSQFAQLRQIYHSLILAQWYKETIKTSLLSEIYVDKNKIEGVNIDDETVKAQIYKQYMAAYKKGVFNYIKEDYDRLSQEVIPRKYFSGGFKNKINIKKESASPIVGDGITGDGFKLAILLTSSGLLSGPLLAQPTLSGEADISPPEIFGSSPLQLKLLSEFDNKIVKDMASNNITFATDVDDPVERIDSSIDLAKGRHAQTVGNANGEYTGARNLDATKFTELGERQKIELAEALWVKYSKRILAGKKIHFMISEMDRTRETLQPFIDLVFERTGILIEPIVDARLNELDTKQRPTTDEFIEFASNTVRPFIQWINKNYKNEDIFILGHGMWMQAARMLLGDRGVLGQNGFVDFHDQALKPNAKIFNLSEISAASPIEINPMVVLKHVFLHQLIPTKPLNTRLKNLKRLVKAKPDLSDQIEILIDYLHDGADRKFQAAVAESIGEFKDRRTVAPLIQYLNNHNESEELRIASAKSLGKLSAQFAEAKNVLLDFYVSNERYNAVGQAVHDIVEEYDLLPDDMEDSQEAGSPIASVNGEKINVTDPMEFSELMYQLEEFLETIREYYKGDNRLLDEKVEAWIENPKKAAYDHMQHLSTLTESDRENLANDTIVMQQIVSGLEKITLINDAPFPTYYQLIKARDLLSGSPIEDQFKNADAYRRWLRRAKPPEKDKFESRLGRLLKMTPRDYRQLKTKSLFDQEDNEDASSPIVAGNIIDNMKKAFLEMDSRNRKIILKEMKRVVDADIPTDDVLMLWDAETIELEFDQEVDDSLRKVVRSIADTTEEVGLEVKGPHDNGWPRIRIKVSDLDKLRIITHEIQVALNIMIRDSFSVVLKNAPRDETRTKIVATLGPASYDPEIIENMILSGVNVFRLNFSHINTEDQRKLIAEKIRHIRRISDELKRPVGIMQDLSGPKIRIDNLDEPINIKPGEQVKLISTTRQSEAALEGQTVPIKFKNLLQAVEAGHIIKINDGKVKLKAINVNHDAEYIEAEVIEGILIERTKGVNLPDSDFNFSSITKKDKSDIVFGLKHGVDYMALSFVQTPEDIEDLKQQFRKNGLNDPEKFPLIIAKIETQQAIDNIQDILPLIDVVMVARGDLAVETAPELVPGYRKMLIREATENLKPVILATQVLASLENPHVRVPSASDFDGIDTAVDLKTDALMLSGETTIINGDGVSVDPVNSVQHLRNAIAIAEKQQKNEEGVYVPKELSETDPEDIQNNVSEMAVLGAQRSNARAIVAYSYTGTAASKIARLRPNIPIRAISENERTMNRMLLMRGVRPVLVSDEPHSLEGYQVFTDSIVREIYTEHIEEALAKGEKFRVVIHHGKPPKTADVRRLQSGTSNTARLVDLTESSSPIDEKNRLGRLQDLTAKDLNSLERHGKRLFGNTDNESDDIKLEISSQSDLDGLDDMTPKNKVQKLILGEFTVPKEILNHRHSIFALNIKDRLKYQLYINNIVWIKQVEQYSEYELAEPPLMSLKLAVIVKEAYWQWMEENNYPRNLTAGSPIQAKKAKLNLDDLAKLEYLEQLINDAYDNMERYVSGQKAEYEIPLEPKHIIYQLSDMIVHFEEMLDSIPDSENVVNYYRYFVKKGKDLFALALHLNLQYYEIPDRTFVLAVGFNRSIREQVEGYRDFSTEFIRKAKPALERLVADKKLRLVAPIIARKTYVEAEKKTNKAIGKRIKQLLSDNGWTLRTLATKTGISKSNLSTVINGRGKRSEEWLNRIAVAFNMDFYTLLGTEPIVQLFIEENRKRKLKDRLFVVHVSEDNNQPLLELLEVNERISDLHNKFVIKTEQALDAGLIEVPEEIKDDPNSVFALPITSHLKNMLYANNIVYIEDLEKKSEDDLAQLPRIGKKSASIIKNAYWSTKGEGASASPIDLAGFQDIGWQLPLKMKVERKKREDGAPFEVSFYHDLGNSSSIQILGFARSRSEKVADLRKLIRYVILNMNLELKENGGINPRDLTDIIGALEGSAIQVDGDQPGSKRRNPVAESRRLFREKVEKVETQYLEGKTSASPVLLESLDRKKIKRLIKDKLGDETKDRLITDEVINEAMKILDSDNNYDDFNVVYHPAITHPRRTIIEVIYLADPLPRSKKAPRSEPVFDETKSSKVLSIRSKIERDLNKQAKSSDSHLILNEDLVIDKQERIEIVLMEKSRHSVSPIEADELGGIDMNYIPVNRTGSGVDVRFTPNAFEPLMNADFNGFIPVIINMIPIQSVLPLLGLEPREKSNELQVSKLD